MSIYVSDGPGYEIINKMLGKKFSYFKISILAPENRIHGILEFLHDFEVTNNVVTENFQFDPLLVNRSEVGIFIKHSHCPDHDVSLG